MALSITKPSIGQSGWGTILNTALDAIVTFINGSTQPVNLEGLLAARPSAASVPAKSQYFATDDNGGKLYRSNGTVWTALAAGVTEMPASAPLGVVSTTSIFTTTSVYPTYVPATGYTGCTFTFPASGAVNVELDTSFAHSVTGKAVLFQVVDGSANVIVDGGGTTAIGTSAVAPATSRKRLTGTPGASLTLDLQVCVNFAGTGSIGAGVTKNGGQLRVMAA